MNKRSFLQATLFVALTAIAAPGMAADTNSEPGEGQVSINYFRPDGNYKGWGLHAWARIPGGQDTPIDGVEWLAPMKPAGQTEEGGVFWKVKLSEFGKSGTVWYLIHKGDSKEQGGKDQSFDGNKVKQVWVNQGDSKLYTSKEEAIKARQK